MEMLRFASARNPSANGPATARKQIFLTAKCGCLFSMKVASSGWMKGRFSDDQHRELIVTVGNGTVLIFK